MSCKQFRYRNSFKISCSISFVYLISNSFIPYTSQEPGEQSLVSPYSRWAWLGQLL